MATENILTNKMTNLLNSMNETTDAEDTTLPAATSRLISDYNTLNTDVKNRLSAIEEKETDWDSKADGNHNHDSAYLPINTVIPSAQGMSDDFKQALHNIFLEVAYSTTNGASLLNALDTVMEYSAQDDTPDEPEDSRTLVYKWDLTGNSPLVDTVSGAVAESHNVSFDSNGALFASSASYIKTGVDVSDKTVEVDFTGLDRQGIQHGRFIMFNQTSSDINASAGFIYRSTGKWAKYFGSWADTTLSTIPVSGTAVYKKKSTGKSVMGFKDVELFELDVLGSEPPYKYLEVGASSSALYNVTVTAIRIYEGTE